jgi:hypothetical protein
LDVRRLTSLIVVALFVLPLLAPLIAAVPVSAQVTPLRVTNLLVTAGGELGFILNRTGLIAGHPVQGAPVLYFWASKNPDTTLVGDEFLLATLTVGTATQVVFGTLLVNTTIGGWLGAGSGNIYLKVTSSRATGALAVVSDKFTLLVDPVVIEKTLRVRYRDLAFYPYFGRSDIAEFVLNLSEVRIKKADLDLATADKVFFNLISVDQTLYARGPTAVLDSDFLRSLSYTTTDVTIGGVAYSVARLTGEIKNFALINPRDITIVNGTAIGYKAFALSATAIKGSTEISGVTWVRVDKSKPGDPSTGTATFEHVKVSMGWTKTVNIYPTVEVTFNPGVVVGDPDSPARVEVGDTFTLKLRNFKPGAYTLKVAFFFRQPDFTYVKLPYETSVNVNVPSSGTVTVSDIKVIDNPYGGRLILITVNVSAGWALAGDGVPRRVWPSIDLVLGFKDDGTLDTSDRITAKFVPGEYMFIRGRGFLVATPTIDLVNKSNGVRIPLTVAPFAGVYDNGTFGAIVQIPPATTLYSGNPVALRAYTGAHNNATVSRSASFTDVRVFIEPRPSITRILTKTTGWGDATPVDASIELGARKFPSPATWESEADRRFTVLAYGIDPTRARFNVSIISAPVEIRVATNMPRTGVGSLFATFDVPEAPFRNYQVRLCVGGADCPTQVGISVAVEEKMLSVSATLAAVDPADGVAKKRVFLPVAVNLTLLGFGFEAGKAVKYDIPMLGVKDALLLSGPAARPTAVAASAKGSFAGWIDLPSIIRAPGVYTIRVHQNPAEAEIIITIGVPAPPFTVRVVTGAAKFADLPLDIWVLAFYGGSLAKQDQVTSVSLAVYLRVGDGTRVFTPATTVAVPGQAVFYARFTAPADALGRDLLVVATVKAKFSPIATEDTASDVTSVAIPPARLSDLIAAITTGIDVFNSALEQLTAISGKLDTLSTALGTAVKTIRDDIADVRSDIAGVVALLLNVNTNVGLVAEAVLTVADQNNAILARLGDMDAKLTGVSSGVAKLSTDVAGLATLIRSGMVGLGEWIGC